MEGGVHPQLFEERWNADIRTSAGWWRVWWGCWWCSRLTLCCLFLQLFRSFCVSAIVRHYWVMFLCHLSVLCVCPCVCVHLSIPDVVSTIIICSMHWWILAGFLDLVDFSRAAVHTVYLQLKVMKPVLTYHHLSDLTVWCSLSCGRLK